MPKDCVVTAISEATGIDYKIVNQRLSEISGRDPQQGLTHADYHEYLMLLGWRFYKAETPSTLPPYPEINFIYKCSKHLTADKAECFGQHLMGFYCKEYLYNELRR